MNHFNGRNLPPLQDFFHDLNEQQFQAVTAPINVPLQVIAGPGTGKTKVLVCRVAYLLIYEKLDPSKVIVTTFTRKATAEMVERLTAFLKPFPEIPLNNLLIGTFHSICIKILKRYSPLTTLPRNFKIADEGDYNQILKEILKRAELSPLNPNVKYNETNEIKAYKRFISTCKSYHRYPDDVPEIDLELFSPQRRELELLKFRQSLSIYYAYQQAMNDLHLIDFDDCLLAVYDLLKRNPHIMSGVEHVLVDEFQDTNEVQLELVFLFSDVPTIRRYNVTIVGDPDQSIYGFRDSQPSNFAVMEDYYSSKAERFSKIYLNQNYRSTKSILQFSEALMKQQTTERQDKHLNPNLDFDTSVKLTEFTSPISESDSIANTIELLKDTDNDLKYSDIAILLRSNFLSRPIERGLLKKHIPYIIIRGHSFYSLKDVRSVIDYLRFTLYENDWLACSRILNFPKRSIGPGSIQKLQDAYEKEQKRSIDTTLHVFLHKVASDEIKIPRLGANVIKNIGQFLSFIKELREFLADVKVEKLPDIINVIINQDKMMEEFLNPRKPEENEECLKSLSKNMDDLKDQLSFFIRTYDPNDDNLSSDLDQNSNELIDDNDGDSDDDDIESNKDFVEGKNYDFDNDSSSVQNVEDHITSLNSTEMLIKFLESINIFNTSDTDTATNNKTPKVAICSIHASKGLEWPVVFVPTLCEGIMPAYQSLGKGGDEISSRDAFLQAVSRGLAADPLDEELRCFYVASTRAKKHLHLSTISNKGYDTGFSNRVYVPSRFLAKIPDSLVERIQNFTHQFRHRTSDRIKDYFHSESDDDDKGDIGRSKVTITNGVTFKNSRFAPKPATTVTSTTGPTVLVPNPDPTGPPFIRQPAAALAASPSPSPTTNITADVTTSTNYNSSDIIEIKAEAQLKRPKSLGVRRRRITSIIKK